MNESYSYDKNIKHTLRKLIDQKKNELKLMRDELNQLSENFLVTDLLPQGLRSTQLSALDMEQEITSKAGKFAGLRKEIDDLENFGKSISAEIEGTYKASLDRLNSWLANAGAGPYSPEGLALNEPIWNTSGQPLYGATPEESPGSQPNVEIENAAAPVKSEEMEIPKYPKPTQRDDIEPTRHFA